MPPKKTDEPHDGETFLKIVGSENRAEKGFESDLALKVLEQFYPALLETCTDADEEVDTQAAFEVLAGMLGLFIAEYQEYYGHEKAMGAFQDLIDLALNVYEDRTAEDE